jgi:hypothetical protein
VRLVLHADQTANCRRVCRPSSSVPPSPVLIVRDSVIQTGMGVKKKIWSQ